MDKEANRAHHDLGGAAKFMCEPVDLEPHGLTAFDREVDALRQVLAAKKLQTVDELRRGIEAIPEADLSPVEPTINAGFARSRIICCARS